MTDTQPKDLLELPMFRNLAKMFDGKHVMHRCEICGNYNFETEMFDDPTLGWVDNACLDAHIDDCCSRWGYDEIGVDATFHGERE